MRVLWGSILIFELLKMTLTFSLIQNPFESYTKAPATIRCFCFDKCVEIISDINKDVALVIDWVMYRETVERERPSDRATARRRSLFPTKLTKLTVNNLARLNYHISLQRKEKKANNG